MSFKSRFTIPAVAAISFCFIGGTTPAYADLGDQLFKLLPDDGAATDRFGISVAISGDTAVVGAYWDDDNGSKSGSVYLFDTKTGRQMAKLLPNDGATNHNFGVSVAVSGTIAIVGAWHDDDACPDPTNCNSGSAYLFDISDPANPTQLFKLLSEDGAEGDLFGFGVALCGATAIVGAYRDDDNGTNSGSAYLFDIPTGRQISKLLASDGAEEDRFGAFVAISGTTAIVGASKDDDNGTDSGSAYLFDISDPANPMQIAKLLASDGADGDRFGGSVAISGATAIVGATKDDDNGTDSGSAYLFDTTTGRQLFKLLPDDGAEFARFGVSSISGITAMVGAPRDGENGVGSGAAYLFNTSTGMQIAKILPLDGAAFDSFGISVALSGPTAIGGATLDDDDDGTEIGSAYLFDATSPGKCPWDLDDNGIVGVSDLLSVLAAWSTDPGGPPDFDGDGSVGETDLAALLANWGPCP